MTALLIFLAGVLVGTVLVSAFVKSRGRLRPTDSSSRSSAVVPARAWAARPQTTVPDHEGDPAAGPVPTPEPGDGADTAGTRPVAGGAELPSEMQQHAAVAGDVLLVADGVASLTLRRRLVEALAGLSGLSLIEPARGTTFDPARHVWESSVPAEAESVPQTVADVVVPGLVTADGVVASKARVVVVG